MKILGIDTSTDIFNLALIENGRVTADYKIDKEGLTHSSLMISCLKDILRITDSSLKKLDGISVSIGPGSFTGLRIGLATAKGLAYSLSLPITGINCLDSYSLSQKNLPGILCPMIKARKDIYYFTLFNRTDHSNALNRIDNYQCVNWFTIQEKIAALALNHPVFIFGFGLQDIVKRENNHEKLCNIFFVDREQEPPGAVNVALIGEERMSRKQYDDLFLLSPFYIHKSSAEIKLGKN